MKLVLASGSPRRVELLKLLGIAPDHIIASDIDETQKRNEKCEVYPARLAEEKATAVAKNYPDCLVLGADTVVISGAKVLPKAETNAEVEACLKKLSGKAHRVLTAIALITPDQKIFRAVAKCKVRFRPLSDQDIAWYVQHGEGIGKAGGYALQGRASAFIKEMQGTPSTIIGLPLYETAALLARAGYRHA